MLNDKRIATETEVLLGSRDPKSGRRAVRWDDLTNANLVKTLQGAGIGGGSSGGGSGEIPDDLEERIEDVEGRVTSALNAANAAADTSQNALLAAENAISQVDAARDDAAQLVADLRTDLTAEYTDAKAAAAMQLPSTFEQGKLFWTDQRVGNPASVPDTADGTPVLEPGFGWVMRMAWNSAGRNLMTKGVVPAPADKIIRVTARFVVRSFNIGPTINLNISAIPLDASYALVPGQVFAGTQEFAVGATVHQITRTFAVLAGEGVDTAIAAMATAQFMRFGIRQEQSGIAEIDFLSLSVRDVTYEVRAQRFATAANQSSSEAFTHANNSSTSAGAANESKLQAKVSADDSLLNTAVTLPATMEGDGKYWQQGVVGAPAATNGLAANVTFRTDAAEGRVARIPGNTASDIRIMSKGVVPLQESRVVRVRARVRLLGAISPNPYRLILSRLGGDYLNSSSMTVIPALVANLWMEVEAIFQPEVGAYAYYRAGFFATGLVDGADLEVAWIKIEDITAETKASKSATQADLSRRDAVFAKEDAEDARAGAETTLNLTAQIGVAAKQTVALTFPKTMEGNGQWWSHSLDTAPANKGGLHSFWTYGNAAVQGPYIEAAGNVTGNLPVAPIQAMPNVNGRRIRLRWTARHVGAFNGSSATAILAQFRNQSETYGFSGTLTLIPQPGGIAFSAINTWQTFYVDAVLNGATPWVLPFIYIEATRMPAGSQAIQISKVEIEDITAQNEAENFAAAANLHRADSVVALQGAEAAKAGAESALDMSAEVAGQGFSCLNDTLLVSSDWGRWGGQGTRTVLANAIYPIGRTWQFNVTAAQNDGIQLLGSPDTIWIGQTNAQAYVVEIMFTLLSGSINGSGARVVWRNSAGGEVGTTLLLTDMQAGEGVTGRARVARGVFMKPSNFTGTFASMRLFIFANWTSLASPSAKNIQFHRVNIRPATAEEMGQGQVMNQVQAHLTQNYLTVAETNQALASFDLNTSATLGTGWAAVKQSQTALASLNGTVARFRNVTTVDGMNYAGIEAVAFSGAGTGTGTMMMLYGDQVIVPGSLSAREVVVHDGSGNIFPDPQFASLSLTPWTPNTNGQLYLVPTKVADLAAGTVKSNAPAATVLAMLAHGASNPNLIGPNFEAGPGDIFNLAFDAAVVGGASHDMRLRIEWLNNLGATIGTYQELRVQTAPAAWQRYSTDTAAAPAGTVAARIRIFSVGAQTAAAYLTNFQIIRKRSGAVLITPKSIAAPLLNVEELSAITANVGLLQSFNFNAAAGTGWRISNDGTMIMPHASVGTLEIAGNAVTVPISAVGTKKTGGSGWQTLVTVTVDLPANTAALLLWSAEQSYTDAAYWGVRVLRGSTELKTRTGMLAYADWPSGIVLDTWSGSGPRTYTLSWNGGSGAISAIGTLVVLGAKR